MDQDLTPVDLPMENIKCEFDASGFVHGKKNKHELMEEFNMEEKILEICNSVDDSIDYTSTSLIDDGLLDSVTLISIISEFTDEFDVYIPYEEIIPENFNSIKSMAELVEKYV